MCLHLCAHKALACSEIGSETPYLFFRFREQINTKSHKRGPPPHPPNPRPDMWPGLAALAGLALRTGPEPLQWGPWSGKGSCRTLKPFFLREAFGNNPRPVGPPPSLGARPDTFETLGPLPPGPPSPFVLALFPPFRGPARLPRRCAQAFTIHMGVI